MKQQLRRFAMSSLSECRKIVKELDTGNNNESLLLPGFRFHPTDEELVGFYLHRMVEGKGVPESLIPLVEFYRHDPWDLPQMAPVTENVWFFFVPRDRKYPNGARPNRVTASGYWKATGTDRKVAQRGHCIGLKKTLVFYRGRAPKGTKTNWIMNEFRLPHTDSPNALVKVDVTLCRVYKKANSLASPRFVNGYKPSVAMHREAQAIVKNEHLVASTSSVFAQVRDQHEQLVPSKDSYQIPSTGPNTEVGSSNTTDESSGLEKLFLDDNSAMQLAWLEDSYDKNDNNNSAVDGNASASESQKAGMQLEVPVLERDYWQQDSPGLLVTQTSMEGLLRTVQPFLELRNDPEWLQQHDL